MNLSRRQFVSLAAGTLAYGAASHDPVAPWKSGVKTHPVSDVPNRHTIHTYFNVSPESPDGRHVLYYTSTTREVHAGEIPPTGTGRQVREEYPKQIRKLYRQKQISTPFGTLSPDGKLIFFKLSAASDNYVPVPEGHLKWPRSYQSDREGLVCFDIERSKMLFFRRDWGHPAWDPSSKKFINAPNVMIDAYTGEESPIPNLPKFPGQHLSVSPDGKLFVTDTQLGP